MWKESTKIFISYLITVITDITEMFMLIAIPLNQQI